MFPFLHNKKNFIMLKKKLSDFALQIRAGVTVKTASLAIKDEMDLFQIIITFDLSVSYFTIFLRTLNTKLMSLPNTQNTII